MNWVALAILSVFLYGGYNFFLKLSSVHIHQILGAVILQLSALIVGFCLLIFLRISGHTLILSKAGVSYAVSAGLCIGCAEIVAFYIFSLGVPAALGIPVIVGGTVVAATVYGLVFLRESLIPFQWVGLVLIVSGIVLLTSHTRSP